MRARPNGSRWVNSEAVTTAKCRAERLGGPRRSLAADLAHRSVGADEIDPPDVVAGPLHTHGPGELVGELVVGAAAAHDRPEVELVEGEEAGAELAVGGDPHAVAALAERRRDARDHADV